MVALKDVARQTYLLFSLALLFTACTSALIGPGEQSSSLIVGRVVVNNQYAGFGHLPIGILDKGLAVEIESLDSKYSQRVTTEEHGYFFVPNVAPNTYHVLRVTIERISGGGRRQMENYGMILRRPVFAPVPGKVNYIGSLTIDVARDGALRVHETWENEAARTYSQQRHAGSLWALREFVGVGPKPDVPTQVSPGQVSKEAQTQPAVQTTLKVERPEWKVGYEWRYAWTRPGSSGTFTREIIREDSFEGTASYVIRVGKNEEFYAKDTLGLLGTMSGSIITLKRNAPFQPLSWPLEVGKEWRNRFVLERTAERSSQAYDNRMLVSKVEEIRVPAGIFEAFKIENYRFSTANLVGEYWYSPKAKWFVKERLYEATGVLERELIGFKAE